MEPTLNRANIVAGREAHPITSWISSATATSIPISGGTTRLGDAGRSVLGMLVDHHPPGGFQVLDAQPERLHDHPVPVWAAKQVYRLFAGRSFIFMLMNQLVRCDAWGYCQVPTSCPRCCPIQAVTSDVLGAFPRIAPLRPVSSGGSLPTKDVLATTVQSVRSKILIVSGRRVVNRPKPHLRLARLMRRSTSTRSKISAYSCFLSVAASFFGRPSAGPDNRIPCSLQNRRLSLFR